MTAVLETPQYEIPVEHLGPVWEPNPDWDGVSWLGKHGRYLLPELTLGYQAIAWAQGYPDSPDYKGPRLLAPDSTEDEPLPFMLTFEQYRFVLWWYAIDENGYFLFRRGVLQRLKGWGKDPLAAFLSLIELLGPCRFKGWASKDLPQYGYEPDGTYTVKRGDPVGKENPNAWVQIAAVTKFQTQNTMQLYPSLVSELLMRESHMRQDSIGITKVTAFRGRRQIQAVTSNPRALEGGRPSLVIKNETEHWVETNNGWLMDAAIDRNAAKSKDGAARSLAICNAPEFSEESVGLREREAYLKEMKGLSFKTGVLYDSLEIPEQVSLFPPGAEEMEPEEQEIHVKAWLEACIRTVRGDSVWLNAPRIALEIMDRKLPSTSMARRYYFNQTIASEDAWVDIRAAQAAIDEVAALQRVSDADQLRCGWIVRPDEPIVMFFDGSKSDDATALVGCRVSDGYCFVIGVWQPPPQKRKKTSYVIPRSEVDARVEEAFERFNVIGFWADPSHAKEDESGAAYWDGIIDEWHRRYKGQLQVWSTKTGANPHSIMWDMASPLRTKMFVEAAEQTKAELEYVDPDTDELMPQFRIDGHPHLIDHLRNSRRSPGLYGVGMRKESRESLRKIDLAVAMVGARLLRRVLLNSEPEKVASGGWAYSV